MSILSDVWNKKITFETAAIEIGQWVSKMVSTNAVTVAAAGAIQSDLKQAASNAVALADTALGALIAPAAMTIEAAANTLIIKAIGPGAVVITPAVDAAITTAANALKAEVDAVAAQIRSQLTASAAS